MNLKNKPPVFVPICFRGEFEKLSKAALMDMVWVYAWQMGGANRADAAMAEFRTRRDTVLVHRKRKAA